MRTETPRAPTRAEAAVPLPALVAIKERTFLEILDLALAVVRRRPAPICAASLAGVLPFAFFNAWLVDDLERGGSALFAHMALVLFELPFATAPLTVVLGGMMFGKLPTPRAVAWTVFKSLGTLLVFQGLCRGFLLGFYILSPLVPARLLFVNEVVLLERDRWYKAVRRSSGLCEGRGGDMVARALLAVLLTAAFVFVFLSGTEMVLKLLYDDVGWTYAFVDDFDVDWRFPAALWIAGCFFTVARFLCYIDQRTRKEGWELTLKIKAVAAMLRERDQW